MATYKDSGVDIELGDRCSALACQAAKNTFVGRSGMIGEPVLDEGGFAGALDIGDYYLIQNDDGVGSKIVVAEQINDYATLGLDLVAMVADDCVCVGAEPISITNTLDVDKANEDKIKNLMAGLETAALKHKIVIPGGEIAELGDMLNGYIWNATAVGIVEKEKLITCKNIKVGDKIIGLRSSGFRANGFSLVRHILKEKFGESWAHEKYDTVMTWGKAVLTPSKIYCTAIMEMHGRFGEKGKVEIKGICHVTGGGIAGNLKRVLKHTGLGADLNNLPAPHESMRQLIEIGNVEPEEAYKTWNMGVGMIIVSNDVDQIIEICKKHDITAELIGEVTEGDITLKL